MNTLREAAQQALEAMDKATRFMSNSDYKKLNEAINALRAALAEPELAPAPGYCKHCKQYTIEEPLPAEPVQEPTVEDLQDALADVGLIDRDALDDAAAYDAGATLAQIDLLHEQLFGPKREPIPCAMKRKLCERLPDGYCARCHSEVYP